jgi:signal transduction histidine kinase
MIENILSNAVKYRAPGTPITIHLSQNAQNAVIEFHNLGAPIAVSEQRDLFRSWRSSTRGRTPKGWGIGLAFVKGIVDALNGSIQVESTETKGTTFTVTLPIRTETSQATRIAG